MYLPEIPRQPSPPMRWGLVVIVAVFTLVTAIVVTRVEAAPGYRPPDNQTIAIAVRNLERKVEKLEARIKRLER